jgi:NAD(P)-dependent dehydrogenase (short-subunit alcohol dehydrogenase family)
MSELAVVTGAGSGIGRATAEMLAGRDLTCIVVGRTRASLEECATAIEEAGGSAEVVAADVGTEEGVDTIIDSVAGRPVRTVVHAAGSHVPLSFAASRRADFDQQLAVNLTGPYFLTQGLARSLVDGSSVVFVSSIVAERARDLHVAYATSKAGLLALTKHLAAELAPSTRVNCVSPGATATPMLKAYIDAASNDASNGAASRGPSRLLLGRVAQPAEVAATIVHLALDATAVTGVDVAADCGYKAS